jgi:catechol 2,3-dioxygenase-like lactoylglutathione lyase family enzyme
MPSVRIHHVAFRTEDLDVLEQFYTAVLGLAVVKRALGRSVWLDAGGSILMLERRGAGEPSVPVDSMELVAFAIAARDRADVAARLASAGLRIEARTAYTLYVRDPDGRRIGLSSYPDELE